MTTPARGRLKGWKLDAKAWAMRRLPLLVTCAQFDTFVADYFADRLSRRQRLVFDIHLRMCGACRRFLEAYGRTLTLERRVSADAEADDAPLPPGVPQGLVKAMQAARDAGRRASRP